MIIWLVKIAQQFPLPKGFWIPQCYLDSTHCGRISWGTWWPSHPVIVAINTQDQCLNHAESIASLSLLSNTKNAVIMLTTIVSLLLVKYEPPLLFLVGQIWTTNYWSNITNYCCCFWLMIGNDNQQASCQPHQRAVKLGWHASHSMIGVAIREGT